MITVNKMKNRQLPTRSELREMFVELNPKTQQIVHVIAKKYGSRLAARFIMKAYTKQCMQIPVPTKRLGLKEWVKGLCQKIRSVIIGGDTEGDSMMLIGRVTTA